MKRAWAGSNTNGWPDRGKSEKNHCDGGRAPALVRRRRSATQRGANVVLTLDEKIQYIAERELAAAIAKTRALAGTVMVMNPNTGEILALANWPKFNPNAGERVTSGSADESCGERTVRARINF